MNAPARHITILPRRRAARSGLSYPCAVMMSRFIVSTLGAALLVAAAFARQPSGQSVAASGDGLRFRYMGPESSGRIAAVAGIPGDTQTYYAGAASGGV